MRALRQASAKDKSGCRAAGFPVVDDEPLEGYDRTYLSDPFGNRLEVMERK